MLMLIRLISVLRGKRSFLELDYFRRKLWRREKIEGLEKEVRFLKC